MRRSDKAKQQYYFHWWELLQNQSLKKRMFTDWLQLQIKKIFVWIILHSQWFRTHLVPDLVDWVAFLLNPTELSSDHALEGKLVSRGLLHSGFYTMFFRSIPELAGLGSCCVPSVYSNNVIHQMSTPSVAFHHSVLAGYLVQVHHLFVTEVYFFCGYKYCFL